MLVGRRGRRIRSASAGEERGQRDGGLGGDQPRALSGEHDYDGQESMTKTVVGLLTVNGVDSKTEVVAHSSAGQCIRG